MKTVFSHSCQDRNEKSYCIRKGNGKDLMPPLRISRMRGLQVSSCVHLIYQSRQILENDYRLLNLQPGRGNHWFVKCVLFYLMQEDVIGSLSLGMGCSSHLSLCSCYVNSLTHCHIIVWSEMDILDTLLKAMLSLYIQDVFWSGKINERWLAHWSLDKTLEETSHTYEYTSGP